MVGINKTNWEEQYKMKIKKDMKFKREAIKLAIIIALLEKYKGIYYWIRIYTDYPTVDGRVCDVYFENVKSNEVVAYEISKNTPPEELKKAKISYENWEKYYFNINWVLLNEKDFSDDLNQIKEMVEDVII